MDPERQARVHALLRAERVVAVGGALRHTVPLPVTVLEAPEQPPHRFVLGD